MSITLREYWNTLQESLIEFDKNNKLAPKDDADKKAYMKQRTFLNEVATMGLAVENTSFFFKIRQGLILEGLPEKAFGREKIVTSFAGPLSLAFAQQVYLPHVKRFNDVTLDDQNTIVRTMFNIQQKKIEVHFLVQKLEAAITHYKSDLIQLSMFSPGEISPPEVEKTSSPAPSIGAS